MMKAKYRINQKASNWYYLSLWISVALILLNIILTLNGLSPFQLLQQE